MRLDYLIVEAGAVGAARAEGCAGTVVWLHGLGADARDFEPVVPLLNLARWVSLKRWVSPKL